MIRERHQRYLHVSARPSAYGGWHDRDEQEVWGRRWRQVTWVRACSWWKTTLASPTQLVRGLTRGGYRVDHVVTGGEALARGERDVVLLDLELPDSDGVESAGGCGSGHRRRSSW